MAQRFGRRPALRFVSAMLTANLILSLLLETLLFGCSTAASSQKSVDSYEENEFAEFEEFEEEEPDIPKVQRSSEPVKPPDSEEDDLVDSTVDNEDDDLDVVEENEDFDPGDSKGDADAGSPTPSSAHRPDNIEITKVPIHLRNSWESYYLEGLMILCLFIYFVNFIIGRDKNQRLADSWFEGYRDLLENNFCLVGDDGKKEIENLGLIKETENVFTLWCSGRTCVEGMLVELRFIKRQDLINSISRIVMPSHDEILIRVYLNQDAMDTFVFTAAHKKIAPKLVKEMNDFATFAPKIKSMEKYGVSDTNYVMMNEIGEVAGAILDSKIVSLLNKYPDAIQYIHISDQYSGYRLNEDAPLVKFPDRRRIMMFGFKYPNSGNTTAEDIESFKPLLQMVFYLIEKVRRFRLSREGKNKANKNRQKLEELFLKATHSQRQEAAQAKREEKKRAEKEKILNEEDPERQRKWEEREHRREMKKKTSKMKQIKIKAM